MSLETHIAGAEDKLLDSLHFAGRSSASYVTERRGVSFAPQTASDFKPGGVRLMRFNLADQQGWLEGDTVRLVMTIHNARAAGGGVIGKQAHNILVLPTTCVLD